MTYSPITTEWLDLPEDIRSAAETAVGHLRPLTHAETLLIVGRAIKAERERDGWQPIGYASEYGLTTLASKAHHYCLSVSKAAENEFQLPIYAASPSPKPAAVSEGGEDE